MAAEMQEPGVLRSLEFFATETMVAHSQQFSYDEHACVSDGMHVLVSDSRG
jgi:hypothetical protein